ncbi:MAG TPA: hypothetical protein ENN63_12515 [Bacteroidetes bacterium]|nr:hypothetical protein [Bacteroidota bacterium]
MRTKWIATLLLFQVLPAAAFAQKQDEVKKEEKKETIVVAPSATWKPQIDMEELRESVENIYHRIPSAPEMMTFAGLQNRASSSLMLSKRFNEESLTKTSSFVVEKDQKFMSISLSGSCEQGEIQITIKDPSGKKVQQLVIDPSARVQWTKSITIVEEPTLRQMYIVVSGKEEKETEKTEKKEKKETPVVHEEYIGTWTMEIKAVKATGEYSLKVSTR